VNAVIQKLQYAAEPRVLVLNAPQEFAPNLEDWGDVARVDLEIDSSAQYGFVMAFVTTLAQIKSLSAKLETLLEPGDAKLWLAYPKGSSQRYTCEFNRDTGWVSLGEAGFEGVRQIAVDEDWSALRFRQVGFIKKLTRDTTRAMTQEGKTRASSAAKTRAVKAQAGKR
jgi:hypothetical protein